MNFEEKLSEVIRTYSGSDGISQFRASILRNVRDHYNSWGFPEKLSKYRLSIVPATFQETSYDDITWTNRTEDLRHLETLFQVDCMFHNNGKSREELSDSEFNDYINFSRRAIDELLKRK